MITNTTRPSRGRALPAVLALAAFTALAACGTDTDTDPGPGQAPDQDQAAAAGNGAPSPLADWFSSEVIDTGDLPIHEFRETVQPGDEVAFSGKVMGRMQVFIPGRAAFIVGDPDIITTCDLIPGDDCETPWDACCEDPANIAAGIVTVQLVGEDGRVLPHDIRGVDGLVELSEVSILGTVAAASGNGNLIIEAARIHVHPAE